MEQELLTLSEHLSSGWSIVSFLCSALFVLFILTIVSSVFWPLYRLSFDHCIVFLLTIVSSVFWSLYRLSFDHCIVCLLTIVSSVFWPLYRLYFDHCIVCLLTIVSSVFWPLYRLSFNVQLLIISFVNSDCLHSPTKVKHHLTCFNNIFSNNELISNRFAVFVTCTHILT
jgi:uncharacterized membrane protein YqjE